MAGDYSKFSFRRTRRVAAVTMQQGRVQLDSDWNEQAEVVDLRVRKLAADVWGRAWVSALTTPDAFKLTPVAGPDLGIGTGRLYADGLAPEVFAEESWTYKKQPFLPDPPPIPAGRGIAYLDVFIRELTWVEAPELLEKALHGVDTATRRQVAWQVRLHGAPNATCGMDLDALFPPSAARLTTTATAIPASDDPCILSPTGGYRGLENRLYRVQVHVPGPLGTAKFKWSRENASIVSPVQAIQVSGTRSEVQVLRIGRDAVLRFSAGDWIEVTDDRRELMGQSGDMARVDSIDETTRTLFLDRVVPDPAKLPFGTTAGELAARHTRVIRWDQSFERHGNVVDADGLMTTGPGPIPLEDGVQASFSIATAGGAMKVDDHWSFEARTVDGSIRELNAAPPDGVRHVLVPLAVINAAAGGGIVIVDDCRNLVPGETTPPGETRPDPCKCCTLCIGEGGDAPTLEAAVAMLGNVAPEPDTAVRLCLAPGEHDLVGGLTIARPNVLVIGCFPRSRLRILRGGLRFAGSSSGLLDVVVEGSTELALVVLSGQERATDQIVQGCRFEAGRETPVAVLLEAAIRPQVLDNDFLGAGIGIRGNASEVRIEGNSTRKIARSGIVIDGSERPGPIEILRNRLLDGSGAGIEANGFIEGLSVIGNEITGWRGENLTLGKSAGGIVLEAVDDLVVRDNRIADNGTDAPQDCAGIRIQRGAGVEIARNRIEGNGREQVDGNPVTGGIVIDDVRPGREPATGGRGRFGPALLVLENVVRAPRAHALFAVGRGDMRVQDNTLVTVVGAARGIGPNDLDTRDIASVVLLGGRELAQLASKLVQAGADSADPALDAEAFPVKRLAEQVDERTPGRVLVQGNQVALERHGPVESERMILSAVTVWGFEDVDLSHNEVEILPGEVRYAVNTLVVARTTRQVGNRFTEPEEPGEPDQVTRASLMSLGRALNTCSLNQGTRCILAFGPTRFVAGNLVLAPTSLCRGQG